MKIVLLSTKIEAHAMNFAYCMDLVDCEFSHIPLPLATIAALTPDDVDVRIIDENVEAIPEHIDADVIAFTAILCQKERTLALIDKFKNQGKTVVVGGPLVDDLPDECQLHADAIFIGEAEYTWPQFIKDYKNKSVKPCYQQKEWVDMSQSPIPRFDLLNYKKYSAGCLQVTRGCPYRCEYCDVPAKNGGFPRSKPIENVLEEIRQLVDLGYDSIFVVDDHFAGNRKFAKNLLNAIADLLPTLPNKVYFYTQATLNVAKDDELLELFRKAAFRRLFIGIETSDTENLLAMNKKHNIEYGVYEAIEKIQNHGITVWAGILFGLNDDEVDNYQQQFEFIMNSAITPVQMGLLQAMPDTPLYEKIKKEGRLRELPELMGASGLGDHYMNYASNIVPKEMDEKERNALFATTLKKIFSPESYGQRIISAESKIKNRSLDTWPSMNAANTMAVLRTAKYYLFKTDWASKKMFFKVLGSFFLGKTTNLDELLFHLVIYKHLKTFYFNLADNMINSQTD